MSDRKALLIGANQFKSVTSAESNGCVNDVNKTMCENLTLLRRETHKLIKAALKKAKYDQSPQLEADATTR